MGRLMRVGTGIMGERMVTLLDASDARTVLVDAGWSQVTVHPPPNVVYPVAFALAVA